jgi:hypothetical protein
VLAFASEMKQEEQKSFLKLGSFITVFKQMGKLT